MIREVDLFKSSEKGNGLSEEIHRMFRELKESLKSENKDECISMKESFDIRIEEIMKGCYSYTNLHKPAECRRNSFG